MGSCFRPRDLLRRVCLLLVLLVAAGASPRRAGDEAAAGYEATAHPRVFARSVPRTTAAAPNAAGRVYVSPGTQPAFRPARAAVHLTSLPAPGGGTMAVIPESLYPAGQAAIGPDGRLRVRCDDSSVTAAKQEAER